MNLIVFVLSLILVLSAMTYARLDSFLKGRYHANEWSWVMRESERDLYNRKLAKCTPKENKPPQNPADEKSPPPPGDKSPRVENGTGRISLAWFFKPEFRIKHGELVPKMEDLAIQLVENAWGNQPFYIELAKEQPEFVRAMFEEIVSLVEKNSSDKMKIKTLDDLIFLQWSDLKLKTAFGRMLQEGLIFDKKGRDAVKEEEIEIPPKGFQSLNDYFVTQEKDKIRVWLAPRKLVLVLFPDPGVAEAVIQMREELYRELSKKDAPSKDELGARFKEAFSDKTPYLELVDFTVTATNIKGR